MHRDTIYLYPTTLHFFTQKINYSLLVLKHSTVVTKYTLYHKPPCIIPD